MELLEWDAGMYDSLPLPHQQWGSSAIKKLNLLGNETVIEFGCGTGRDCEVLLEQLPNGRVIAIDGSHQMLAQFRARLASKLDRVTILQADMRDEFVVPTLANAALSIATFHWLPNHESVFRNIATTLEHGAKLVIECGGAGNIAGVRKAMLEVSGSDGMENWNFANVEETKKHLQSAGFTEIEVKLVPDPAIFERGEQLEAYLAIVVLGAQLREMASGEHRRFVQAVANKLSKPEVDYVRLQIEAIRI